VRLAALIGLLLALTISVSRALPENAPVWPLSLRNGLPTTLPGYAAAPRDPLPDSDENEMGTFTEVSRFFQRIESETSVKQFRLVVQDYGAGGKDLAGAIRKAVELASRTPNVDTRELKIAGLPAFAVTDRSGPNPTTLVTVIATPARLVLAQGANVDRDEAVKLLGKVDFQKIIDAK
jgi:hypothetical protein